MIRLTAIVSGGQTGADRGALDAAIALSLGYGGWAPQGWRAEDGEIPAIYRDHMRESKSRDYGLRTRLNVQDSDATLILSFSEQLSGGSAFTAKTCKGQRKQCKHLVLPAKGQTRIPDAVRTALLEWIRDRRISVLNVAGPRESKEPGIQEAARDALVWIFEDEIAEPMLDERPPLCTAEALAHVSRQGAPDVRGLATFLCNLECCDRPPSRNDVDRLSDEFYGLDGNGAGGSLHVVLDDHNWERDSVEFCRKWAADRGDVAGERFAELLLTLSDDQLHAYLGPSYCGRCCADYGDSHTGQTFDNVDGRCPDCGSWPASGAA